ncbi:hypothetical protein LN042_15470 [Kitasatospora sp. RB6PN24]|uniref:hypothetical protein n=1 Tax=Kitasatospora humi TaxID=2893891 RepID=UPI001E45D561|nr:hypothetical protein [Kitasatospora humi]MCC9308470.1 hypothetical protein [Kitasatospora humi]
MDRPLLLLDVDGPLNPYAAEPERRPPGYLTLRVPRIREPGATLRVWLNPDHGAALLALEFELCWATAWEAHANRWVSPAVDLPELPHIDFGTALLQERPDGVHWKTERVVEYAAGRPFAWVDDELREADEAYVAAHHHGPALLHHVNPRIGLRDGDFTALADFARSLRS